ncbi:hypothetical protein I3843_Q050400 [Carya illinoinensis]|nr:hypothetical protein I3843_Q050400 [Carya illinoinensis]
MISLCIFHFVVFHSVVVNTKIMNCRFQFSFLFHKIVFSSRFFITRSIVRCPCLPIFHGCDDSRPYFGL